MNKTTVYVVFAALVALAIIESLVILTIAPVHFPTFSGFIVVLLGLATTFAATVWAFTKQGQKIEDVKVETSAKLDVVQKQTNGTLTRLIGDNEEKSKIIQDRDAEIAQLRAMLQLPAHSGGSNNE